MGGLGRSMLMVRCALVTEANRIKLAHYFDPYLAIHSSLSIRCPTRFRRSTARCCRGSHCASSSRTIPSRQDIMAGLLIKELIARERS